MCRVARVKLLDGPQKGRTTTLTTIDTAGSLNVAAGDRIRVYTNTPPQGAPAGRHFDAYSLA